MTEKWGPVWHALFDQRSAKTEAGCLLWSQYVDGLGYGRLGSRHTKQVKSHRASYELAKGEIPSGMVVMHTCDVRHCVNPDHLILGTQADNVADMVSKKRHKPVAPRHGSQNPISVLDEDKAWEIRALIKLGIWTQKQIADDYGVSPMTISRIANNKTWTHVETSWG